MSTWRIKSFNLRVQAYLRCTEPRVPMAMLEVLHVHQLFEQSFQNVLDASDANELTAILVPLVPCYAVEEMYPKVRSATR